jgi:hypothetical protein
MELGLLRSFEYNIWRLKSTTAERRHKAEIVLTYSPKRVAEFSTGATTGRCFCTITSGQPKCTADSKTNNFSEEISSPWHDFRNSSKTTHQPADEAHDFLRAPQPDHLLARQQLYACHRT